MKEKMAKMMTRRMVVSLLMFLSVTFGLFPQPAHAQAWGAVNIFSDLMMNVVETIKRQMEGMLLGTLKMAAIQTLNNQVSQLVGGSAGGRPLFITDYNEFLYQGPRQRTDLYMNDFFSTTTRGKGSSANYIGVGDMGGLGGNYAAYLRSVAESTTTRRGAANVYDLEEYVASPDQLFARGDFRGLNAFFSNPANNTFGYTLQAEEAYQNQLDQEEQMAMAKAIAAGGFLPNEKNGVVTAPAATIEAAMTNVQNIPNQMIAAASNPGELLSGVVSAMANKLVSNLVQKGVGEVQSKITKEISSVNNKMYGEINNATKTLGPAVRYMGDINKNLNVNIRTSTPPPPSPVR
ncbi:MAG: hypothetical protein WAV46_01605 [Candidatus Moraniibacteriota bacterium]